MTLKWGTPGDGQPDGYVIYQGTSRGEAKTKVTPDLVQDTSYTVHGLANGKTYYFVVAAVVGVGDPDATWTASNEVSATPVAPPRLGAPTGLTATAGDHLVILSWNPPPGGPPVSNYAIYRGTSRGGESGRPVYTSRTDAKVTGLVNGKTYYFVVKAANPAGQQGPSSGEAWATPVATTLRLGAPARLTATAGDSQVTLSWNRPADGAPPAGYYIYQGTSPGQTRTQVTTSLVKATRHTVHDLANGTTYYFVVKAANRARQQGPSSREASATPRAGGPLPPLPAGGGMGGALPAPSWSVFGLPKVLESLALGALLVALVGFPAELFDRTYEHNEARIRPGLAKLTRWKARETEAAARPLTVVAFFAVAATLTTLVEPNFNLGWTGATMFLGFAAAIPLTMAAYAYPFEWYERRASKINGRFRVLVPALGVAILLTVMSRLVHFVPGYVYGLIATFAATRQLSKPQKAKSVLAGTACVFGLSIVAWIVWGKYYAAARGPHASHIEVIAGAVLAQLAILGIMSVVFGLMPFKFMDGYSLRTWNLRGWIAVYVVAASWFVLVLIRNNPVLLQQHHLPVAFAEPFILFAIFGVLSFLFWFYFRLRPSPGGAAKEGPPPRAMSPSGRR